MRPPLTPTGSARGPTRLCIEAFPATRRTLRTTQELPRAGTNPRAAPRRPTHYRRRQSVPCRHHGIVRRGLHGDVPRSGCRSPPDRYQIAAYALLFGVLGATLNASRTVLMAVGAGAYDTNRTLWQLIIPLHGGVLALITVVALTDGVLPAAGGGRAANADPTNFATGCAAIVGFATDLVVIRIKDAARTFFGSGSTSGQDRGREWKASRAKQDQLIDDPHPITVTKRRTDV